MFVISAMLMLGVSGYQVSLGGGLSYPIVRKSCEICVACFSLPHSLSSSLLLPLLLRTSRPQLTSSSGQVEKGGQVRVCIWTCGCVFRSSLCRCGYVYFVHACACAHLCLCVLVCARLGTPCPPMNIDKDSRHYVFVSFL